jgi:hypothetical protein
MTPSSRTTPWMIFGGDGIKQQYSTSYTPQQNDVSKRKNWTLMNVARTMMAEFKCQYNFWAKLSTLHAMI